MKRRALFLILALVAVGLAVAALFSLRRGGGGKGPNLLLITLDTTRADHLGCYGKADATTPNLDALARSGVKFTRAFCNVPLTLPSHATMMTGLYPPEHGLRVNGEKSLAPDVTTLAQVFSSRGYRTAAFVAAFVLDSRFGLDRGFHVYDDYDRPGADEIFDDSSMYRYRSGKKVADAAIAWIRRNRGRPFFCWVHFFDPHRPYYPHPKFDRLYPDSPYDSEVSFMDEQVGRLIRCLKENGLLDTTVVIAAGDHGEGLGEHGEVEHGLLLYNASMRVPLIVSSPGRVAPGSVADPLVSLVDLFPTILDIFGWTAPGPVSGRSVAAALRGGTIPPKAFYAETEFPLTEYGWSPLQAVVTGEWKYVRAPREELYDEKADPRELENLAAKRPEEAARMRGLLASLEEGMRKHEASEVELDEKSREVLASLGYLGGGGRRTAGTASLRDPKDAIGLRSLFVEASGEVERGNIGKAEADLRKLIEESPETRAFRAKLARMYYEHGMFGKAVAEFGEIAKLDPDDYGSHYNLGKALIKAGRYNEAVRALRKALEIDPGEPAGLKNLGIALFQGGRFGEALDAFRRSLAAEPNRSDTLNNLGNVLLALGRYGEAEKEFRRALELTPGFFEARYNLGLALYGRGRYDEAAEQFREALRLRPGFPPAREQLALCLARQRAK